MLAYEGLVVFIFYTVGLWHWWMLKDTLFWLFGTAVILFLNTTKATEEKHYFRKVALDNFKFAVVLTFIINLYVFNLITELLLVPVVAFLAMLGAVAATKTEFKPAKRLINGIMAAIGIAFVAYAVVGIATNFHGFATLKNFEDFMTPVVLTLTLLPFIYFLALYSAMVAVRLAGYATRVRQATYCLRQASDHISMPLQAESGWKVPQWLRS